MNRFCISVMLGILLAGYSVAGRMFVFAVTPPVDFILCATPDLSVPRAEWVMLTNGSGWVGVKETEFPTNPPTYSVLAFWDKSTDPSVRGCHVYYGTNAANFSRVTARGNSILIGGIPWLPCYFEGRNFNTEREEGLASERVLYNSPPLWDERSPVCSFCARPLVEGAWLVPVHLTLTIEE